MSEKYLGNVSHVAAVSVEFGVWEEGRERIILTWKSGMSGALLGGASQIRSEKTSLFFDRCKIMETFFVNIKAH